MEDKDKAISKVLSDDEMMVLFEMMTHPGWGVFKKVGKAISADWIEQAAHIDMSHKPDEQMLRMLRHRQGQIKGGSMTIGYLEKKMKERKNTKVVQENKV